MPTDFFPGVLLTGGSGNQQEQNNCPRIHTKTRKEKDFRARSCAFVVSILVNHF